MFCQNHDIAHQRNGVDVTPEELAEWYIKLQDVGNVHKWVSSPSTDDGPIVSSSLVIVSNKSEFINC